MRVIIICVIALAMAGAPQRSRRARAPKPDPAPAAARVVRNRVPLKPGAFALLPLGAVRPEGWLERQLEIQARGLTGRLDEFWPDVGPNSGWLGGTGESWERGPYYLDGLVPLAYLLDDPVLIAKAQRYVDWTLTTQADTGWLGPKSNTDWWPNMVMLKVLTQYQEATGDPRVVPALTRYFAHHAAAGRQAAAARLGRLSLGRRTGDRPLALQPDRRPAAAGPGAHVEGAGHRLAGALRHVCLHRQDLEQAARLRRTGAAAGRRACARTASTSRWRSRPRRSGR